LASLPRAPEPTLCPYTTLFRSSAKSRAGVLFQRGGCELPRRFGRPGLWKGFRIGPWGAAGGFLAIRAPFRAGRHEQPGRDHASRSEEHTSELQSREKLVCRLLL